MMQIKTLSVGQIQTNCYVVTDETTKACAIIDPGDESEQIIRYLQEAGLTPEAIFVTHGHYDHTVAIDDIIQAYDIPVYIHPQDTTTSPRPNPYRYLADQNTRFYAEGDTIPVGGLTFSILGTPGHSPGSVVIQCENALFTGDTLFLDSCGRTDLPGGDMDVLMGSLRRLFLLPGDYTVYPGHMQETTLDRERRFNYYLKYAGSMK